MAIGTGRRYGKRGDTIFLLDALHQKNDRGFDITGKQFWQDCLNDFQLQSVAKDRYWPIADYHLADIDDDRTSACGKSGR